MKSSIYILLTLLFLSNVSMGQTTPSNENYILQVQYQVPLTQNEVDNMDTNDPVNNDKKIESIVYYDGLGRPKQNVSLRAGGNREDLVIPIRYDAIGRQPIDYLPLPMLDNHGGFNSNTNSGGQQGVISNLVDYYEAKFPGDAPDGLIPNTEINPYSVKRLENSPLNRVLEQAAPGYDWLMSITDNDHTIKFEYGTNTAAEVRRFYVTYSTGSNVPILHLATANNGNYPAQTLFKNVTKDENWQPSDGTVGTVTEFVDKLGQVVLKRSRGYQPAEGLHPDYSYDVDTYYIYDDYGNLVFVLSPEGSDRIVSGNSLIAQPQPILDNLCYQYRYDYRNRLVWKKVPGKGYETILYNNLNLPVLTQDGNMRNENPNKYLFTKYDALGRVAYTGFHTSAIPKQGIEDSLQSKTAPSTYEIQRIATQSVQIGDALVYYTNSSFPTDNLEVLTINYYDKYVDYTVPGNNGLTLPTTVLGQNTTENTSVSTTALGLPTVSRVRILGQFPVQWTTSLTAYDSKGRAIYSDSYNEYLESRDVSRSKLDLITGRVIESHITHNKEGQNALNIYDYFTYDHMGRLLSQKQRINTSPLQLIAQNEYDELGQLVRKNVGGETLADGYTDIDDLQVTYDGTVTMDSPDWYWPAALKTKGKIPATYDGGIRADVLSDASYVRIGLVRNSNTNLSNDYVDYGITTAYNTNTHLNEVLVVEGGTVLQPGYGTYTAGTTFKVERVGSQIRFSRNGSVFKTINLTGNGDIFVGKVAMSGPGGSIADLTLFGTKLDKKLQEVDYAYNIRGWLTDINDIDPETPGGLGMTDLFNFRINYNRTEGNATNDPLYNGNIAQTLWKTANSDSKVRGYAYSYDDLNRITGADSYKGTTLGTMAYNTEYTVDGIHFDKNGNILSLKRRGANDSAVPSFGQWDDLEYTYEDNGNKLAKVDENSISFGYNNFGFKDGTNTGDDYTYDDNGNMKTDLNKEIYNITYNHLNLPEVINFDAVSSIPSIHYVYDAVGTKLSKWVIEEGTVRTEYANGFVYNNAGTGQMELQFFSQAEGYVKPVAGTEESVKGFDKDEGSSTSSSYKYVFQYKDHLGNVRLSYSDSDLNGAINPATEIIEESNYYPFGLEHKGYNTNVSPNANALAQQWKYNGVELNESLGINLYEMDFRQYDPALARFTGTDPVVHHSMSPYVAFDNNPVYWADPSGADSWSGTAAEEVFQQLKDWIASKPKDDEDEKDKKKEEKGKGNGRVVTSGLGSWYGHWSGADEAWFAKNRDKEKTIKHFAGLAGIYAGMGSKEKFGGGDNGYGDAKRHAYWMYLIAMEYGPDVAREYGEAHEDLEGRLADGTIIKNKETAQGMMDLNNNDWGINLAQTQGGNLSMYGFDYYFYKGVLKGDIQIIHKKSIPTDLRQRVREKEMSVARIQQLAKNYTNRE